MTTIPAHDVRVGMTIATIPSRATGRTTSTRFANVTSVDAYTINGIDFVDINVSDGGLTCAADNHVELVSA